MCTIRKLASIAALATLVTGPAFAAPVNHGLHPGSVDTLIYLPKPPVALDVLQNPWVTEESRVGGNHPLVQPY